MEWRENFPQDHAAVDWAISGLPGELDMQQLLRDTEEKLKMNACSIEQSLKELQVKLGDSWPGDKPSTPADCFQWFSPHNLTLLKPSGTGQQQLLDLLRALQQFLRTEEKGREESILQLLLDVSSQCGVAFPRAAPLTALHPAASPPVHAVRDEAAVEALEVWEDIRLLLRRHLLDELQSAADPEIGGVSQRILRLQELLFLYPEEEVLFRYRSVRVKATQDVLRSAQGSSSAETAFERAAAGFRAASPALLRLVGEDLRVLSAVVEPAAALAFVNHAHLATVALELGSVVEKLLENSGKDCGASAGKVRKASAKSRVAVAPQEEVPRRRRSLCLTSHQLTQLTLLAGALLDLEERVEELAADLGFLCPAGESPCSVRGILKKTRDDPEMPLRESSRSDSETLPLHPEATALGFGWRSALAELAPPMAHCVRVVLEDVCTKSLQQEEAAARASGSAHIVTADLPRAEGRPATGPGSEPPKIIAKFAGDIMEEVEALFPLALACWDASLLDVRASFVEVVGRVTSAVLGRLQERGKEVPISAPLRNLPVLLATGVYLEQRLSHYATRLADPGRMSLSLLPVHKCQELTGALQEHLTSYCIQTCATCILHDPESHHWGDPKPFYEGERCSFSIQMWHYFLWGLRSDLWASLPPGLAQELLAQVLSHTLEVLVRRYSRACPSYRRTQQIRTDITATLLCVEQLMWSVCSSARALVRPGPRDGPWIPSIHSLCDQLLAVLAVVTAPLPTLCEHFCGDADKLPSSPTETASCDQGARWLHHIDPSLFLEESVRTLAATEELGVIGRLRLACSQPDCSYTLLLQALLQSDCVLLQVLLSQSRLCTDSDADDSTEIEREGDAFLEAVFSVLSMLSSVPKALAQVFESHFHRQRLWDRLCSLPEPDSRQAEPVALRCLRAAVTESIDGIVGNVVAMVTAGHQASEDRGPPAPAVPESVLSKVPKEWNYTSQDPQEKEDANGVVGLLLQAVSFIFANLPSAAACLPLPVRFLLHAGETHLSQNSGQPRPAGLVLRVLLGFLCQRLEGGGSPERLADRPRGRGVTETLALVAECLRAAVGHERGAPNPAVREALQTLEEKRPKWSSAQLQKTRKVCAEGLFAVAESGMAQERGGAVELTEQKIGLMVLEICHGAGGSVYLRQIYHIIRRNEELLASLLSSPLDPTPAAPRTHTVILNPGPSGPRPTFDPIIQFNRIGARQFDQSAVSDWIWDWAQLLPAFRGMSQVTLKTLLANRWDLRDGAALEDEERALADLLRKAYFGAGPGS